MRKWMHIVLAAVLACGCDRGSLPEPFGVCPTAGQLAWQRQELTMFFHFGPSTFSGLTGEAATNRYTAQELIGLYRPQKIDAGQWAEVAAEAGFQGVILTAKHHDGFSLWPAPHSVCHVGLCPEPYNQDVIKSLSEAARRQGLNMGVYLSPWDKNDPAFGTEAYNSHYTDALKSLLDGSYGTINEVWFDGNGADRSPYDFALFNRTVYQCNPDAVIFSNIGPGCRWVGNEAGIASETNWSAFSPDLHGAAQGALPGDYEYYLGQGDEAGAWWIPAEADMSIRPTDGPNGWFWQAWQEPKSARELMKIYYETVGRNAQMLLNVPPTAEGVLDARDIQVLMEFKALRDSVFSSNLADGATAKASSCLNRRFGPQHLLDKDSDTFFAAKEPQVSIEVKLDGPKSFNRVLLQEYIPLGQRVKAFRVEVRRGGRWEPWAFGTTIGYKRILLGPVVTTDAVRVLIDDALAPPVLARLGLHWDTVSGL